MALLPAGAQHGLFVGLGVVELMVAALLIWPRSRGVGRIAGLGLLVGFSIVVALHADDRRFLANCGCLGQLSAGIGWQHGPHLMINAMLAGLLISDAVGTGAPTRHAVASGTAAGLVLLLGSLYLGEHTLRLSGSQLNRALARVLGRNNPIQVPFPNVPLVRSDGQVAEANDVLRGDDHLIFFDPDCALCKRLGSAWEQLGDRLRERGHRLLLITVDGLAGVASFKKQYGCRGVEHAGLRDRRHALLLGITSLPKVVVLDGERRVRFNEALGTGGSFVSSTELVDGHVQGWQRQVWDRIARALFDDGCTCGTLRNPRPGVHLAAVTCGGAPAGSLAVVDVADDPAHTLEVAIGIRGGQVVGLLPLAAGGYFKAVGADLGALEAVVGQSIPAALTETRTRARKGGIEAPLWRALHHCLGNLSQALGE